MSDRSVGYAGIIVQSFAVFVAIAILLGRIYFLTYLETLGVPATDVRLNVVDYSVISPDVTVLGVGFAVLWAVLVWGLKFITSATDWQLDRIIIGIVLAIVGSLVSVFINYIVRTENVLALNSGVFGLALLLPLALSAAGGAIFASGFPMLSSDRSSSSDAASKVALMRPFVPIIIILAGVFLVFTAVSNAMRIGTLNARYTLLNAPEAKVALASDAPAIWRSTYVDCHSDFADCKFQIIFIGDKYVYLRPVDTKPIRDERGLYALPIGHIEGFEYISKENPCTYAAKQSECS